MCHQVLVMGGDILCVICRAFEVFLQLIEVSLNQFQVICVLQRFQQPGRNAGMFVLQSSDDLTRQFQIRGIRASRHLTLHLPDFVQQQSGLLTLLRRQIGECCSVKCHFIFAAFGLAQAFNHFQS